MTAQHLTNQFNLFQNTFEEINNALADPDRGLKDPATMMLIKTGMSRCLGIGMPKIVEKGVNALFITDLVAKVATNGDGLKNILDKEDAQLKLKGRVCDWAEGIEKAFGIKNNVIVGIVEKLFQQTADELKADAAGALAEANRLEAEAEKEKETERSATEPKTEEKQQLKTFKFGEVEICAATVQEAAEGYKVMMKAMQETGGAAKADDEPLLQGTAKNTTNDPPKRVRKKGR